MHADEHGRRELLEELLTFVKHLDVDCTFITHHTIGGVNLSGRKFLARKERIIAALEKEIEHGDMDRFAFMRSMKTTL